MGIIELIKKVNLLILEKRVQLFFLLSILAVTLLLEIIGLGSVLPMISILFDENYINNVIDFLSSYFPSINITINQIYFLLPLFFIFLYVIKTISNIYLSVYLNRYIFNLTAKISNKIYSNLLEKEYPFFLKKNTSEFVKILFEEVNLFSSFLIYFFTLIVEISVIIIIITFLLFFEPLLTLAIVVFFSITSYLFYYFFKKKLTIWGQKREVIDKKLYLHLNSSFGAIKEIMIYRKNSFFEEVFFRENYTRSRIKANNQAVIQFPKIYLELIFVFAVFIFISTLIYLGFKKNEILILLGLFGFASLKIIPSLSKILNSLQQIKFYVPSLDIILKNYISILKPPRKFSLENSFSQIEFINVRFGFSKENHLIEKINLTLSRGESIGIMGKSGSGKSTLLNLLVGLLKPSSGKILINGLDIFKTDISNTIGFVSQFVFLNDDSILNNIIFGLPEKQVNIDRVYEILKIVELEKFVETLTDGIYSNVGERGMKLSGGQIQRIGIARALYRNPDIMIFDESTSALDQNTEKKIMKTIYDLKNTKTLIIVSHKKGILSKCDRIFELKDKNIKEIRK